MYSDSSSLEQIRTEVSEAGDCVSAGVLAWAFVWASEILHSLLGH